jgi:hypothetical protein
MTSSSRSPIDGELQQRTYVTCLNCGAEIAYNWDKMRREGRSRILPAKVPLVISIGAKRPAYDRPLSPVRAGAGR